MKLVRQFTAAALSLLLASPTLAWAAPGVDAPHDGDAYSRLVAQAEAGDAKTDFRALRFAWLDSAARTRAKDTHDLATAMWDAVKVNDAAKVRATAEQILTISYVDLDAHKLRRQACVKLADQACAEHEHFIEFGMLNSITSTGDGKTPETAWHVASVDEEYFIMRMVGAQPGNQALVNQNGRIFDRLDVKAEDGTPRTLWFDITDFFSKEFR